MSASKLEAEKAIQLAREETLNAVNSQARIY